MTGTQAEPSQAELLANYKARVAKLDASQRADVIGRMPAYIGYHIVFGGVPLEDIFDPIHEDKVFMANKGLRDLGIIPQREEVQS